MGVVLRPVSETHPPQELPALLQDGIPALVIFLGHELPCQGHVLQGRILGEEVEGLEHQAKVQPPLADLRLG